MITGKEIKKAVNRLLSVFDMDIYGMDVAEGYEEPCFFTEAILQLEETINLCTFKRTYLISITYFQKVIDEADALDKQELIRKQMISEKTRYKMMLEVENRLLPVSAYHINWTGENSKIPQYIFTVSYMDHEELHETGETMKEVRVRMEE